MRIRALDINPSGKSLVILRGPNEQGKTSAIQAIISALTGKRADPDVPIRVGAETASVELQLADDVAARLRIRVKWTPTGRYLTVHRLDTQQHTSVQSPQAVLDELVGALSFNPLTFADKTPKDQARVLLRAIGKEVAYHELEIRRQQFYDDRTNTNRQAREISAMLATTPDPAPAEELCELSIEQIANQVSKIKSVDSQRDLLNEKWRSVQNEIGILSERVMSIDTEVVKLEQRLAALRADRNTTVTRISRLNVTNVEYQNAIAALPNTDQIKNQLALENAKIAEHNQKVAVQRQVRKAQTDLKDVTAKSDTLTIAIREVDTAVRELLQSSFIGSTIPGLAIDLDGIIVHNGIPISQASGMRKLELSCLIGMILNPKLRAICIDEGDKLDPQALEHLRGLAEKYNFQFWMTAIYAGNGVNAHVIDILDGARKDVPLPDVTKSGRGCVAQTDTDIEDMLA
jgi:hypothetical protein